MQNGIERGNLKWSSAGLDDQRVVNRFPANLLTVCSEGEHFKWFVTNDKRERKPLPALKPGGDLPTLERYRP